MDTKKIRRFAGWSFASLLMAATLAAAVPDIKSDLRLVEAAKSKDKESVRALLKEKADPNSHEADGTTALSWAAHWDDLELADALIAAGANVNAANDYGVTPLSIACTNRNAAMAAKLLKAKANPNSTQWTGETALMTASAAGSLDTVKVLLESGAEINTTEPRRGQSALMWAIAFEHPDIAKVLIEHGADVKAVTHMRAGVKPMMMESYGTDIQVTPQGGYTPLMFAARVGDLATAKLLVAKGVDVNQGTKEDGTPLVLAAAGGYQEMALFLLDHGADANAKDGAGITPLHYAMRDGIKVLHGIDISNVKRVCGAGAGARCTAGSADIAVSGAAAVAALASNTDDTQVGKYSRKSGILPGNDMLDLAKALLAHGADPNAQIIQPPPMLRLRHKPTLSVNGATPFFLAAAAGDLNSMKILVESHAKPHIATVVNPTEFGKTGFGDDNQIQGNATPLMVAAGMGRHDDLAPDEEKRALEAVRTLIEMGADVNATTETGWTALHAASFGGANSIVQLLVEKGAKINAQNGCAQTPLSLAEGTSARGLLERVTPHKSTTELLKKLGAGAPAGSPIGKCIEGRFGLEYATVTAKGEKASGAE